MNKNKILAIGLLSLCLTSCTKANAVENKPLSSNNDNEYISSQPEKEEQNVSSLLDIDNLFEKESVESEPDSSSQVDIDSKPDVAKIKIYKVEEVSKKAKHIESFTVPFPKDDYKIQNNKYKPLKLNKTRSIKDEYYTVYNENTGCSETLNAFDMVCRIVSNEMADNWHEEAIKAQAISAYSYVRYSNGASVGLASSYSPYIAKCVKEVEGQAVYYNDKIADTVYTASTAGCTTTNANAFGSTAVYPYLTPVISEYDKEDTHWNIKTVYSVQKVREILENAYGIKLSDNIKDWFKITSAGNGIYINQVLIDNQITISGKNLFYVMGLPQQYSGYTTAIKISYSDGNFTFTTFGYGHGAGMSQWGARLYAEHGWTYDQILRHYFNGTTVKLSYENKSAIEKGKQIKTSEDRKKKRAKNGNTIERISTKVRRHNKQS